MNEQIFVAQVDVLQDSTQSSVELFSSYGKALSFVISAMTDSREVWLSEGEDEERNIIKFIDNDNFYYDSDYTVKIVVKNVN